MDLHCTASNASVCDAQNPAPGPDSGEFSSAVVVAMEPSSLPVALPSSPVEIPSSPVALPSPPKARQACPGSEEWMAERTREKDELDKLEARITELWGHINAATAQFLALLAEFDRKEGWAQHGVASCAHWLNWQCGISSGAARGMGLNWRREAARRALISSSIARRAARGIILQQQAQIFSEGQGSHLPLFPYRSTTDLYTHGSA